MTIALRLLLSLVLTLLALSILRFVPVGAAASLPVFHPLVFGLIWLAVAAGVFISPGIRGLSSISHGHSNSNSNSDREQGEVKWFNISKGYGFITRNNGEDIFVHFRAIRGEGRRGLREGEKVEFSLTQSDKGPQAEDVQTLDGAS